jgi:hypothetical protein
MLPLVSLSPISCSAEKTSLDIKMDLADPNNRAINYRTKEKIMDAQLCLIAYLGIVIK